MMFFFASFVLGDNIPVGVRFSDSYIVEKLEKYGCEFNQYQIVVKGCGAPKFIIQKLLTNKERPIFNLRQQEKLSKFGFLFDSEGHLDPFVSSDIKRRSMKNDIPTPLYKGTSRREVGDKALIHSLLSTDNYDDEETIPVLRPSPITYDDMEILFPERPEIKTKPPEIIKKPPEIIKKTPEFITMPETKIKVPEVVKTKISILPFFGWQGI